MQGDPRPSESGPPLLALIGGNKRVLLFTDIKNELYTSGTLMHPLDRETHPSSL